MACFPFKLRFVVGKKVNATWNGQWTCNRHVGNSSFNWQSARHLLIQFHDTWMNVACASNLE